MAEPWQLAEPLAAAGVDEAWLEQRRGGSPARRPTPRSLGRRDADGAQRSRPSCRSPHARMSSLVGAVKSYAYMDRGGVVEVDLHEGLETTLTVLGHKLKHTRSRSCATTTARCRC